MRMLTQKVVLITGAGSGVGRMAALACAREGACVAIVDLDAASGCVSAVKPARNVSRGDRRW
jgi:NAD(P)-dependent dehydrogenase (short-subunit alcohol dehydrogenase family)